MQAIDFQPGTVGREGMADRDATKGPSVPLKAEGSGSGGIDEQPGFEPDAHSGLHPGNRVMGIMSTCWVGSAKTPLSGEQAASTMNGWKTGHSWKVMSAVVPQAVSLRARPRIALSHLS